MGLAPPPHGFFPHELFPIWMISHRWGTPDEENKGSKWPVYCHHWHVNMEEWCYQGQETTPARRHGSNRSCNTLNNSIDWEDRRAASSRTSLFDPAERRFLRESRGMAPPWLGGPSSHADSFLPGTSSPDPHIFQSAWSPQDESERRFPKKYRK